MSTTKADSIHNYYLPYLRTGMASTIGELKNVSRPTVEIKLKVSSTSSVETQSKESNVNVALYGPGDVLGFNERIVSKTQPVNQIGNFNASLIPYIEFTEADFLWRYSAKKEDEKGKYWIPWLSLIVLKEKDKDEAGEFNYVSGTNPELPRQIELNKSATYPNLEQSWRWAHVHMNDVSGLNKAKVDEKLRQSPQQAVCRLLCPRRLKIGAKYTAFVIPTYVLGGNAALGNSATTKNTNAVLDLNEIKKVDINRLPYYYKWDFRTGHKGDFEYLIKQLEFGKLQNLGTRSVDGNDVGYGLSPTAEDIQIEGALRSTDTQYADLKDIDKGHNDLANLLDQQNRVVPPIYGKWFSENPTDKQGWVKKEWIKELNLDYRHRYAAGLGAQVIRDNQEELMKSAWQQLSEVKKVNRALNHAKFGREVSNCLYKKLEKLPDDKLLLMGLPLQSKVTMKSSSQGASKNVSAPVSSGARLKGVAVVNRTVHNQLKTRINEYVRQPILKKYLGRKFKHRIKPQVVTPSIPSPTSTRTIVPFLAQGLIMPTVSGGEGGGGRKPPTPPTGIQPSGGEGGGGSQTSDTESIAEKVASVKAAGVAIKRAINPATTIEHRLVQKIKPIRSWEQQQQDKAKDFVTGSQKVVKQIARDATATSSLAQDPLCPVISYPEFDIPVFRYLRDKSQQLLLPGLEQIAPNTVSLLTTNSRFIEAFMVGLNHEFASELRWREYPADMRGTYFRKFWETTIFSASEQEKKYFELSTIGKQLLEKLIQKYPSKSISFDLIGNLYANKTSMISNFSDEEIEDIAKAYEQAIERWLLIIRKDIDPIADWNKDHKLGENIIADNPAGKSDNQAVLLIRGDILNKFPSIRIYLSNSQSDKHVFPIFEANLPPDIVLLGFPITEEEYSDYLLVFEEPVSEVQYGLDEEVSGGDSVDTSNVSWQHFRKNTGKSINEGDYLEAINPLAENANNWNNPSFIAKVFTQKSARLKIPLRRFFKTDDKGRLY